jgi:hypothetical protein
VDCTTQDYAHNTFIRETMLPMNVSNSSEQHLCVRGNTKRVRCATK